MLPKAYVNAVRAFRSGPRRIQESNVRRHWRAIERAGLIRCYATIGRSDLYKLTEAGERVAVREGVSS
jgi:DNA-binding PadR family transcriptional regulator